ncbi:MAG: PAS domain S-box protein, partial [Planctomycetes bacterium]|nr:PAS domain S-box protein [Planctomycetota bacterium]
MTDLELLQHRFDRERRARLEAESLLEAKSLELFELNEELRRLNETLERRVSDRTAELSETNSRLLREMEEREKAETRFRLAVEASPNGKIIVNRAGLIVMVNSKAEQQFGYQRDQLVGQPVEILVPAAVRSGHAALREHFFTAIHSRPMGGGRALAAQRRDGSIFPAELSLNPIETADGLQVLVSIVDITARLESERQLRQREQELSDFFDNAAVGLHWLGPDGVIKRANRAELDMLGYSDSEYVGQHASAFHVDQSAFTEMLNRLLSGQTVQNYEVRMRTRSGLIKHVALTSNSYFEDGVFQHSRCFMVDITERKLAEEKLAESSRMALFTARICESLIHGGTLRVTLGICADLILEHLDGVWARIWVHNPEENRLELQARAGDELPCDRFYKLISGGESKIHRIAKTRRPLVSNAVADDCHELCSEVTEQRQIASFAGFPLILQDRLVGVVALYSRREVTTAVQECLTSVSNAIAVGIDRFQTESRLEYAKEAAESASRTKNEFLANMSHELRTPLTAITGYADLLSAPEQRSTQDIKWARQILRSARHLGMLLDDILDLAKVEAGRIKVENRPCEIKSLVEEVAEMFRPQAIEKLLEFRVEHDPAIPQWILLDPTRLRQVLTNLVSNALKFTQVGRVQIIVKRRYSESVTEDDEIEISVVDSGVGMTTDQLQQLFQPFQRLHQQTLTVPGTGLGLAISHRLVELMRGRFDIASEPAKGTRFSIILPLQEVAADYSRLESGSAILSRPLPRLSSRVGKEDELRGLRVLLVDD